MLILEIKNSNIPISNPMLLLDIGLILDEALKIVKESSICNSKEERKEEEIILYSSSNIDPTNESKLNDSSIIHNINNKIKKFFGYNNIEINKENIEKDDEKLDGNNECNQIYQVFHLSDKSTSNINNNKNAKKDSITIFNLWNEKYNKSLIMSYGITGLVLLLSFITNIPKKK
jgi:hypothetical protein